jgi:hypothetical protein
MGEIRERCRSRIEKKMCSLLTGQVDYLVARNDTSTVNVSRISKGAAKFPETLFCTSSTVYGEYASRGGYRNTGLKLDEEVL